VAPTGSGTQQAAAPSGAASGSAAAVPVDVTVCHLANRGAADKLAAGLAARLAEGLAGHEVDIQEVGAVLGAHVGPGMVAVSVGRHPGDAPD
jgi:fatty acid-binding protein DegV